jgi:predicted HicB family RNase H-like nuclease
MAAQRETKLFGVRVPVELHKRLKLEAVRRGVSMAALVEAALRQFLSGTRGATR